MLDKPMVSLLVQVPSRLRRHVRVEAARQGITIARFVIDALTAAVECSAGGPEHAEQ